jgi:hypothetical protein
MRFNYKNIFLLSLFLSFSLSFFRDWSYLVRSYFIYFPVAHPVKLSNCAFCPFLCSFVQINDFVCHFLPYFSVRYCLEEMIVKTSESLDNHFSIGQKIKKYLLLICQKINNDFCWKFYCLKKEK